MESRWHFLMLSLWNALWVLKTCRLEGDRFAIKWNLINFPKSSTQDFSSLLLPRLGADPVYHPSLLLEVKLFKLDGI